MCLIALAWRHDERHPLVVAANRDEFHARAAAPANYWDDAPQLLAGRDQTQGGTWLGVTRTGKFAGITNARGTLVASDNAPSRGWLLRDYLMREQSAAEFAQAAVDRLDDYAGFNLFLADSQSLYYLSNVTSPRCRELPPGLYVLSNGHLDSNWPKQQRASAALEHTLAAVPASSHEALLTLLADRTPALDAELPDTGVGTDMERMLSPVFITSPVYGTRCSTVITVDKQGALDFTERRFNPAGEALGESRFAMEWPVK